MTAREKQRNDWQSNQNNSPDNHSPAFLSGFSVSFLTFAAVAGGKVGGSGMRKVEMSITN